MSNVFRSIVNKLSKYNTIVVFLLFFPYIYKIWLPNGSSIYFLDAIKQKWKVLNLLIVLALFLIKKIHPSKLFVITSLSVMWTLVVTIINNSSGFKETFLFCSAIIVIAGIFEIFVDNIDNTIKGLMLNFEIFLYPNLITIFLYRSTKGYLVCHYLLGYYNTMLVFAYPAIALAFLYLYRTKKYIRSCLLIIASFLTILLARGSTPIAALLATLLSFIFMAIIKKIGLKFNNYAVALTIVAFVLCLFILFIFEGGKFRLIDFIIEKILQRSTDFTGRLPIWKKAEEMFLANPLFGYGREVLIEAEPGWFLVHAHNEYLSILVFTGLIGFILFMIFNIELIIKLDKQKNISFKFIFIGLIFGIFISYITECYQKEYMFYIVFFLAYNLDKIVIKENNNENFTK